MSENLLDREQIYAHCIENTCTAMPQVMETDLFQTMLSHKIMKSLSKRIGWHTFTVRIADKILEYDYYSYIEDLFPPFEKVVPEKVAIKMGLAGFYPDGTKMTDKEHAEFIKNHPQKSEEDESSSGERLDENTPTPNLNGDAN